MDFSNLMKTFYQFLLLQCTIFSKVYSKAEFKHVTCGSVVKLYNLNRNCRLHSHDVKYGQGSGQQSVTGSKREDDHNSYWVVKGPHLGTCERGAKIKCNEKIRLQHSDTKRNLHSHLFAAPMSNHLQEISAYGEGGDGDTGDNWLVRCPTGGKFWQRKEKIRLQHDDTGMYLTAGQHEFGRPIAGQREIVGYQIEDSNNLWQCKDGIYVKAK